MKKMGVARETKGVSRATPEKHYPQNCTKQMSLPFVRQQYNCSPPEHAVVQHLVAAEAGLVPNPAITPTAKAMVKTSPIVRRRMMSPPGSFVSGDAGKGDCSRNPRPRQRRG